MDSSINKCENCYWCEQCGGCSPCDDFTPLDEQNDIKYYQNILKENTKEYYFLLEEVSS